MIKLAKQIFKITDGITLECGKRLDGAILVYETFGTLNQSRSNAILIFHALSGDSHVCESDGKPGWWDEHVGPNKSFDTNRYFVICVNVIGGCQGSTGPSSINPAAGKPYGASFPIITIKDMVVVQKKLIDFLGIEKLFAVTGGSMGGMQLLQWLVCYPNSAKLAIPIATAAKQSAQNIAFHEAGRKAIIADPNWNKGDYYSKKAPVLGLSVARMIGHITYLSENSMREKFGRRLQGKDKMDFTFDTEFQVEGYLEHQGKKFVDRFDANSYLYITRAIDYFDLTYDGEKKLSDVFKDISAKFLVLSISSDWLYKTEDSLEIVRALLANSKDVTFYEVSSDDGHDGFLLKNKIQESLIKNFLANNFEVKNGKI